MYHIGHGTLSSKYYNKLQSKHWKQHIVGTGEIFLGTNGFFFKLVSIESNERRFLALSRKP